MKLPLIIKETYNRNSASDNFKLSKPYDSVLIVFFYNILNEFVKTTSFISQKSV
jgi:hypothetical protein